MLKELFEKGRQELKKISDKVFSSFSPKSNIPPKSNSAVILNPSDQLFSNFSKKSNTPTRFRIVVGLNQVDQMIPNGWNERLNNPTNEAEEQIQNRCEDIIRVLTSQIEISELNIEYYSALKRYRLIPLLTKIIQNSYAGFKINSVDPADPFELADSDVKAAVDKKRREMVTPDTEKHDSNKINLDALKKVMSPEDFNLISEELQKENKYPPKVAVIGKSGVGKTTTINNLFNAQLKTSPTTVGTTKAQTKEFTLSTGGTLTVVDLPGYGRSEAEDREYNKIYETIIPECDIVLLILQANTRDFSDDIEMLQQITTLLKNNPIPRRSENFQ
ncbi:GTPase family protein [Laspinema olomoucense]|uniref:50S ribosome-binding GTPase n=1 Tax=Laspinema olomoucense D3b TaxID=2953688 RepID=A0ABT2N3J3_9CYAN|nr:GTPase [Laspinema sp. D3b]MCT7977261.1 50S ribosome-binding GTPase [Laspinema sp. D3b]